MNQRGWKVRGSFEVGWSTRCTSLEPNCRPVGSIFCRLARRLGIAQSDRVGFLAPLPPLGAPRRAESCRSSAKTTASAPSRASRLRKIGPVDQAVRDITVVSKEKILKARGDMCQTMLFHSTQSQRNWSLSAFCDQGWGLEDPECHHPVFPIHLAIAIA